MLLLAMLAATLATFWVPPARGFRADDLARIVFFHLPCAFITTGMVGAMAHFGWRYLRTRERHWDVRAAAATELAALFGVLTMLTGILFSKVQWGAWWQWDPRQTSFLFLLLILGGALALRAGIADELRRAAAGAAYAVAALLPAVFLIFVYPRLPYIQQISFHPTQTVQQGLFTDEYRTVLISVGVLLAIVAVGVYRLRVRAGLFELVVEEMDGNLEVAGGGAADARVVRPVSLPEER